MNLPDDEIAIYLACKAACIDIFNNIPEREVKHDWQSVYEAWKIGRDLAGYGESKPKYDQAYVDQKIAEAKPAWEGVNADEWLKEVRGQE